MKIYIKQIKGGITAPKGFVSAGVHAGIKKSRLDMAILASAKPAVIAGVFTSNKVQGEHVKYCRRIIKSGVANAVVINSGCANACVGPQGAKDALEMASVSAEALTLPLGRKVPANTVYVCSTGTIGIKMPMDKIRKGIDLCAKSLSPANGDLTAKAIMTTDTKDKQVSIEIKAGGVNVRIAGIAKGAGMIEPNMATMLSFITTDANVSRSALDACLKEAVAESFNRISIDGDQSCNDTVFILANGASGSQTLSSAHKDWPVFVYAVKYVSLVLAKMIVTDGEGATKFVTVTAKNARNVQEAKKAVRAVANSLLVKTSWFGCDPNWGRIIDAVGYSGASMVTEKTDIYFDGRRVVKNGCRAADVSLEDIEKVYRQRSFEIVIDLKCGKATETVYTCDCSQEYVRINSEYMT